MEMFIVALIVVGAGIYVAKRMLAPSCGCCSSSNSCGSDQKTKSSSGCCKNGGSCGCGNK